MIAESVVDPNVHPAKQGAAPMSIAAGILGGTTTMLARSATRKVMQQRGATAMSPYVRRPQGWGTMLLWAAAAGVILALADVLVQQRRNSARDR